MTAVATPQSPTADKSPLRSARQVLALLDAFLSDEGVNVDEKRYAWNVLTALRGPDDEDTNVKDGVTVPIRVAALPRTAVAQNGSYALTFGPVFCSMQSGHTRTEPVYYRRAVMYPSVPEGRTAYAAEHFCQHARNAVRALQDIGQPVLTVDGKAGELD